jgi:hypothetical protein
MVMQKVFALALDRKTRDDALDHTEMGDPHLH